MNGYKGYVGEDPLGLNPPSLTTPVLSGSKANYSTITINTIEELQNIPRLVERIDATLQTANGYALRGLTSEVQLYLEANRMDIFMATQKYMNDRREAEVTSANAQVLLGRRVEFAKDFLTALIQTPPVFSPAWVDNGSGYNPHMGGGGGGRPPLVQASPDPDPARLAPLAVQFADELIKALGK